MKRYDFFRLCLQNKMYEQYRWILRVFMFTKGEVNLPYYVNYTETMAFFYDDAGERVIISDYVNVDSSALINVRNRLDVYPGDLSNITEKMNTTAGIALFNGIMLAFPFGNRIPFINGELSAKALEKQVETLYVSDDGGERDHTKIYTEDYLKFQTGGQMVESLSCICVPSASRKTMSIPPGFHAFRDSLIEKNKDRLFDPAVIAEIDNQLVQKLKEYMKGDSSEGFYVKKKLLAISRKKTQGMMGGESAFSDGSTKKLIRKSLSEGIDVETLPDLINSSREGSFDRGAETALGGEIVKRILQLLQNTVLSEVDCKSKLFLSTRVDTQNESTLVGLNIIEGSKLVPLTSENIKGYIGKDISYRTTGFCKTSRANFCQVCIGARYAKHATGIASAGSNPASIFMLTFMAAMHGTQLVTVKYDYRANMK
jgi:hypothetical protein